MIGFSCKTVYCNEVLVRIIINFSNNNLYISIIDLISASRNMHRANDMLAYVTNKNGCLFHHENDSLKMFNTIFIDKGLASKVLEMFPTYASAELVDKINNISSLDFAEGSSKIVADCEKKISNIPAPNEYFLRSDNVAIPIYDINDFHSLTQFLGYVKYINRFSGNVYLRGQDSLYEKGWINAIGTSNFNMAICNLVPSIFRKAPNRQEFKKTEHLYLFFNKLSRQISCLNDMREEKLFPLLQHYGFKTTWLDIVDNIWVALWFSLYSFLPQRGANNILINIKKRESGYSYLFLILSDAIIESMDFPGCFYGQKTIVTDLRKALPSVYLRPHAQHAFMIRKKDINQVDDYSDLIVGIAKIPVEKVYQWVGKSGLVSMQSLFPSPHYDYGYKKLLDEIPSRIDSSTQDTYGSVQLFSYDYF